MTLDGVSEEFEKARVRLIKWIDKKQYSEYEIREKLRVCGFSYDVVENIITYACDTFLLDDRKLIRSFIEYAIIKYYGRIRIKIDLEKKGLDGTLIDQEIDKSFETVDEVEMIEILKVSQRPRYEGLDKDVAYRRIYNFLCRRGFTEEDINKVLAM